MKMHYAKTVPLKELSIFLGWDCFARNAQVAMNLKSTRTLIKTRISRAQFAAAISSMGKTILEFVNTALTMMALKHSKF
jgi:hypothetical protein